MAPSNWLSLMSAHHRASSLRRAASTLYLQSLAQELSCSSSASQMPSPHQSPPGAGVSEQSRGQSLGFCFSASSHSPSPQGIFSSPGASSPSPGVGGAISGGASAPSPSGGALQADHHRRSRVRLSAGCRREEPHQGCLQHLAHQAPNPQEQEEHQQEHPQARSLLVGTTRGWSTTGSAWRLGLRTADQHHQRKNSNQDSTGHSDLLN